MNKPLILSPAGSYEALTAALNANADEIYFGATSFNARQNASNFSDTEISDAIKTCRLLGVKTNITVNTLIYDRELSEVLHLIYNLASLGADAFIVQDLGLANKIKQAMPSVTLHASTQCACHNLEGALKLNELGFSRIVLAREMPLEDIKQITNKGIETEIFVHGALCVCHSGMCLMSSVIGKRSGNRGLCAQPCRLDYSIDNNVVSYPLSLKDLSLSKRIEDILSSGVTSLKIEGRMKSPDYVYGVTKQWREMIDAKVSADKQRTDFLESLFSREGFTDKYFDKSYLEDNKSMYGTRTLLDKQKTHSLDTQSFDKLTRKRNISMNCILKQGESAKLTITCGNVSAVCNSDFICQTAKSNPINTGQLKESLSKLGNTVFVCEKENINTRVDGDIFLPKSQINELRRTAIEKLEELLLPYPDISFKECTDSFKGASEPVKNPKLHIALKNFENIPLEYKNAKYISVPLQAFLSPDEKCATNFISHYKKLGASFGIRFPRVFFADEHDGISKALSKAKEFGATFAVISNIGQIELAKKHSFKLFGDAGLNVYNSQTLDVLQSQGFDIVTLSPELNSAQMRDIQKSGAKTAIIAKGRLELMVLESCIIRASGKCNHKDGICSHLTDRKGYVFPIGAQKRFGNNPYPCRNIIYNSVETDFLSKSDQIQKSRADVLTILL